MAHVSPGSQQLSEEHSLLSDAAEGSEFLGKRNRGKSTLSQPYLVFFWLMIPKQMKRNLNHFNKLIKTSGSKVQLLICYTTVISQSMEQSFAYSTKNIKKFYYSHSFKTLLARREHVLWLSRCSVFQSQPSTVEISSKCKIRLHTKNQQPVI